MLKKIVIALWVSTVAMPAWAQKKLTPEMLWTLKRVAFSGLTTDKAKLYYTERQYDLKTEKSITQYKSIDLKTGKNYDETLPEVSVFQRTNKEWFGRKENSILISFDNGKAWQSFADLDAEADIIMISPDHKFIAYTKEVALLPVQGKELYSDLPKSAAHIYNDLNYVHWDTWEDGKYSHLFVVPVEGGVAKDVLGAMPYDVPQKPHGGAEDITWSPDGSKLIYVCKKKFGKEYAVSTNTDIYAFDVKSGKTTNVTEGMMGYDTNPTFSPDGKYLAFTSMAREGFEADKVDIVLLSWKDGEAHKRINLTTRWDYTINDIFWSNDSKTVYCTAPYKGTVQVFAAKLPPMYDNVKAIPVVNQVSEGKWDITGIAAQVGNELIVSRTDHNHAAELFALNLENGNMRQLTKSNDAIYKTIKPSRSELRMVKTKDGKDMGVWVIYPPDFSPAKKYPTLLYCQGGPQSALSQFYSFRWNFALMAAQGYIVVAPNRRGMPGWGSEWNEAISKDWGGMPMQDYLSAIDAVSKETYVDKKRLGCVGASYGGYSVYLLAGIHQNRFKSFIAHCGLFDMRSWYGTTEEMWFANWDLGDAYWGTSAPKGYTDFNPSEHVAKWNTPILIIHGGKDYRVPLSQGQQAFQAAQLRGIKSRFLYFPDENHWVLRPQNGLLWQREFFRWLNETL